MAQLLGDGKCVRTNDFARGANGNLCEYFWNGQQWVLSEYRALQKPMRTVEIIDGAFLWTSNLNNIMKPNEILGVWHIVANENSASLNLWQTGNNLNGQVKFDNLSITENLSSLSFSNDEIRFTRPEVDQQYSGKIRGDDLRGTFLQAGNSYSWFGRRMPSPLLELSCDKPRVVPVDYRASSPVAQRVLVIVEERVLGALLSSLSDGVSVLTRFFDDLQNEGWEVIAYSFDVRSHESGERYHRHLPAEFLDLYRFVKRFYQAAQTIGGVLLIGDFPTAGIVNLEDRQVGQILEQHELDYFSVDAVLSDPYGYWELMATAPTFPPGSTLSGRLPYDDSRHPNGSLSNRDHWSAPGFVTHASAQWQVHHSERTRRKHAADPKFWVGRVTASQSAWRTGQSGLEYSEEEELRLLADYFNRNHQHRTTSRQRRGYLFLDLDFEGGWQSESTKWTNSVTQSSITVNADSSSLPTTQWATIDNYLNSFSEEYLVCYYMMHSDSLNHYFAPRRGSIEEVPATFPQNFTSPGSMFGVAVPGGQTSIKALHHLALPNRSAYSRFYLLGGCDVGDILHRPRYLVGGERISTATALHRQHGAQNLAVTYLMRCNGLAVLAHNVTSIAADYTPVYQAWQQGECLGNGVLQLMRNENVAGQIPHPYRNIVFGDPTLKLSY